MVTSLLGCQSLVVYLKGAVLGPVLFLIFINDFDCKIVNSILKFADDTKLFGPVNGKDDRDSLQSDLHRLMDWSNKWQMPFNTYLQVQYV